MFSLRIAWGNKIVSSWWRVLGRDATELASDEILLRWSHRGDTVEYSTPDLLLKRDVKNFFKEVYKMETYVLNSLTLGPVSVAKKEVLRAIRQESDTFGAKEPTVFGVDLRSIAELIHQYELRGGFGRRRAIKGGRRKDDHLERRARPTPRRQLQERRAPGGWRHLCYGKWPWVVTFTKFCPTCGTNAACNKAAERRGGIDRRKSWGRRAAEPCL